MRTVYHKQLDRVVYPGMISSTSLMEVDGTCCAYDEGDIVIGAICSIYEMIDGIKNISRTTKPRPNGSRNAFGIIMPSPMHNDSVFFVNGNDGHPKINMPAYRMGSYFPVLRSGIAWVPSSTLNTTQMPMSDVWVDMIGFAKNQGGAQFDAKTTFKFMGTPPVEYCPQVWLHEVMAISSYD